MKQKLKFNNRAIRNWKSDFTPGPNSKSDKSKERVYTPFQMDKYTQFKGLNLCEYKKGEKHFVLIFFIRGQRNRKRVFTVGRFNDNLMINPKFKDQIEIPNLCNFVVLSNSKTPVYIDEEDRRAYVISIRPSKEEIKKMLIGKGYKKDLKDLYDDPSAFKWHLINEVAKTYDREMFFQPAPMNKDKEEMIEANKGEFKKVMDMKFDGLSFPFGKLISKDPYVSGQSIEIYSYKGMINLDTTYETMLTHPTFRQTQKMYWGLDELTDYFKSRAIPWKNGKLTKQIRTAGGYIRVYLLHNWKIKDKYIKDMGEGELGFLFDQKLSAEELNKVASNLPNYKKPFSDNNEGYKSMCWSCKQDIELTEENQCTECNYAIRCSCGVCACDKPGNEHMKKQKTHF